MNSQTHAMKHKKKRTEKDTTISQQKNWRGRGNFEHNMVCQKPRNAGRLKGKTVILHTRREGEHATAAS